MIVVHLTTPHTASPKIYFANHSISVKYTCIYIALAIHLALFLFLLPSSLILLRCLSATCHHHSLETAIYLKKKMSPLSLFTVHCSLVSYIFLGKIVVRSIFFISKACPVNYRKWAFLNSLNLYKHSCLPLWWCGKNCSMKQTVRANPFTLGKLCESPSLLTHLCNEKKKIKRPNSNLHTLVNGTLLHTIILIVYYNRYIQYMFLPGS